MQHRIDSPNKKTERAREIRKVKPAKVVFNIHHHKTRETQNHSRQVGRASEGSSSPSNVPTMDTRHRRRRKHSSPTNETREFRENFESRDDGVVEERCPGTSIRDEARLDVPTSEERDSPSIDHDLNNNSSHREAFRRQRTREEKGMRCDWEDIRNQIQSCCREGELISPDPSASDAESDDSDSDETRNDFSYCDAESDNDEISNPWRQQLAEEADEMQRMWEVRHRMSDMAWLESREDGTVPADEWDVHQQLLQEEHEEELLMQQDWDESLRQTEEEAAIARLDELLEIHREEYPNDVDPALINPATTDEERGDVYEEDEEVHDGLDQILEGTSLSSDSQMEELVAVCDRRDREEGTLSSSGGSSNQPDALPSSQASCVVCLEAPRTHAYVPCGHWCVCVSCAKQQRRLTPTASCPVCQQPSSRVLRIFVP